MVCSCPLGVLVLGFPRWCRPAPTCVLPGASFLSLKQSEVAATCSGLGDSQAKPSCETKLAAASAGSGAHWGQLLLFDRLSEVVKLPFTRKSSLGRPVCWVGQSFWGSPTWSNGVSLVKGVSNRAPACSLHGSAGGGPRKGPVSCAHPSASHFSLAQDATGGLQAATPVLELRGSKSEKMSLCVGSLR